MKRSYYGIKHTDFSINQTAECIRKWGTAYIYRFDSKADRDAWCDESFYNWPCSAAYARKIGEDHIFPAALLEIDYYAQYL